MNLPYNELLRENFEFNMYLMDDSCPEIMEVIELLEKEIELNESSSDYTKATTACEEANGADVVRDGVGSGLENGAGKEASHSKERGLVSAEVVGDGIKLRNMGLLR
ncbi:hypothetical protein MKX03_023039 [Papaver bracteatum]|nr:hypothetical protein MKX03_023039 [Papaver bracteatum]